jgi:hypothetical protein
MAVQSSGSPFPVPGSGFRGFRVQVLVKRHQNLNVEHGTQHAEPWNPEPETSNFVTFAESASPLSLSAYCCERRHDFPGIL